MVASTDDSEIAGSQLWHTFAISYFEYESFSLLEKAFLIKINIALSSLFITVSKNNSYSFWQNASYSAPDKSFWFPW